MAIKINYKGVDIDITEGEDGWGGIFEYKDIVIVQLKDTFVGPETAEEVLKGLIDILRANFWS